MTLWSRFLSLFEETDLDWWHRNAPGGDPASTAANPAQSPVGGNILTGGKASVVSDVTELVERLRTGPVWADGSPIGSVVGDVNGATMNEAADALERLSLSKGEWLPISTAPKDGTRFDAWYQSGDHGCRIADVIWEDRYQSFFTDDDGTIGIDLTHWRRLPDGPATPGSAIQGGEADRVIACPPDRIYMQWSDDGQHIRKWSREPFDGGGAYEAEWLPRPDMEDGREAITAFGWYLGMALASFDTDPPDSDYQRGYLEALRDVRVPYDSAILALRSGGEK